MITTRFLKAERFNYHGETIVVGGDSMFVQPECQSWVAVAVAVVAVGASAYAASEQSAAADQANETNRINAMNTNQLNYEMFRQGRGSQGNAVLPLYSTDADGNPVEPALFGDAYRTYLNTAGSVSPQALANMQQLAAQTYPAQTGAVSTVNDIFNGQRTDRMVANQQPVYDARMSLAQSTKNAKLEALNQTLNEIDMRQARKGFSGDTSGNRRMSYDARQNANTSGAIDIGQAKLANATDQATLRNQGEDVKLNNLSLPYAIGQQSINLANLPSRTLTENQNARLGGMNFFRIGTNQFQYQPLPQVQPVASTGQIVGQAVGSLAQTGLQSYNNQQMLNQQQQANADYVNALRAASGSSGSYIARGS